MKKASAVLALTLLAGTTTWSQQANGQSKSAAASPKKDKAATPVTMTECEGTNNCATWTFLGAMGNGRWPSGESANLSVERYDDNSVVIHRADSSGPSAGLTATYTGTRHGDRVGGEFTSSWPGHWESKTENWYATVERNPVGPPKVMHWCAAHCSTWTLDNGPPFDKPHYGSEASGSIVVVEHFSRDSVLMYRTDYRPVPGKATLRGQLSADGNSIVNGTIEWTWHPCCGLATNPYQAAWGAAINTVPANDAEGGRLPQPAIVAVPVVVPAVCVPWFFGVVCE